MQEPKLSAPAGACDCHMHIYENRYALAPTATFRPPHAPVSEYRKVQQALGLQRVIVVQPSGYGFDNRCAEKALATLGAAARGVAIVPPEVSDSELERLARAGMRGVRFFMLAGGLLGWDNLDEMAARVHNVGWHINLQMDGRDLPLYEEQLLSLPGNLVIDHTGKYLEPVSVEHPAFLTLLRLLDSGKCWVKLAAPYETSRLGGPRYDDVAALARALVRANPERCLWASNWPHPNQSPLPESAAMLDLLLDWADDDATRAKILVANPAKLYGF